MMLYHPQFSSTRAIIVISLQHSSSPVPIPAEAISRCPYRRLFPFHVTGSCPQRCSCRAPSIRTPPGEYVMEHTNRYKVRYHPISHFIFIEAGHT